MSCGEKCAKYFLFVVNVLVWLVGAAFLAIGIWIVVSPATFITNAMKLVSSASNNQEFATSVTTYILSNNQLILIGAYIMIAVGGFLFIVGFCGCCGACKENTCLLIVYIIFCVLAFLVTLAGGICEAVYLQQVDSLLTQGFTQLQGSQFDGMYNSTNPTSTLWYNVMVFTQCCGLNGQSDFQSTSTMATYWNNNGRNTNANGQSWSNAALPACCCQQNATDTVLDPTCPRTGTSTTTTVNTQSCQSTFVTPVSNGLTQSSTIVMGVTFGLAVFCLLAVAAAATLVHHKRVGSDKSV